jgi:hypothetical protein
MKAETGSHTTREEHTMSDTLATYLHDHLAGSTFGIDLLERLMSPDARDPLGGSGEDLARELTEDRASLLKLMAQAGVAPSEVKQAAAWIGEKLSRLKLSHDVSGEFGTFESLEMLSLGILGKQKLWRALAAAALSNQRLRGFDFDHLAARAEEQHRRVEERRVELARTALAPVR